MLNIKVTKQLLLKHKVDRPFLSILLSLQGPVILQRNDMIQNYLHNLFTYDKIRQWQIVPSFMLSCLTIEHELNFIYPYYTKKSSKS